MGAGKRIGKTARMSREQVRTAEALMKRVHQRRQVGLAGVAGTGEHSQRSQINRAPPNRAEVSDLYAKVAIPDGA